MLINIVVFFIFFSSSSNFNIPSSSTSIYETSYPCFSKFLHVSITAGCSIFDVIICFPFSLFAYA